MVLTGRLNSTFDLSPASCKYENYKTSLNTEAAITKVNKYAKYTIVWKSLRPNALLR